MTSIYGTYNRWAARFGYDDGVADSLHGGSGDDVIYGYGGADTLVGNGGHDVIYGGRGDDWITGGKGWDTLTGGSGRDTFEFYKGDSGPSYAQADIITDFNTHDDSIVFQTSSPAGSTSNYAEFAFTGDGTYEGTYNIALHYAQEDIHGGRVQFAFYTDGHDGYLFADLDHNGTVDTGIELRGLTSTGDFSHLNIF
jgi:Ca2+-binding RTX toxin-like protein